MTDEARPVGRPTKYRPEFCQLAVEMGAAGKSFAQIATACGVARSNANTWAEQYPDFQAAIAHARDLSMSWWEEQAHIGIWESPEGAKLNPQLWSRSMAARFPDDYRESKNTQITGPNGGPLQTRTIICTGVPDAEPE